VVTTAVVLAILHSPWLLFGGVALFLLPGAALLSAARLSLRHEEKLAYWFATSLVLLTATFAASVASGLSIAATPWVLALLTLAAAAAARRLVPPSPPLEADDRLRPGPLHFVLVVAGIACLVAAVSFAPVGSVDRWWYLAYVRGYLDGAPLDVAEPFLGTGQSFARFGFHPWLLGLAMWSQLSGLDPVEVYESSAPILVVLASVSATAALAIEMFGRGTKARLTILATMLLWSGGLVPVLARAGEDKVMAASALMPLCLAAFLRALREARNGSAAAGLLLLAIAAIATAAVHALALAFVLLAILPAAAIFAVTMPRRRATLSLAVTLLLAVAVAPAASGLVVKQRLSEIGADVANQDHPVVRVHEARDRTLELAPGVHVTNPRLLFHPLALLALIGLLSVARRSRDSLTRYLQRADAGSDTFEPAGDEAVLRLLLVTSLVSLTIAFFPPATNFVGSIIPPWMVYRVLWILPLAPLAAIGVDLLASRYFPDESLAPRDSSDESRAPRDSSDESLPPRDSSREWLAVVTMLVLGLPSVLTATNTRLAEVRERLAPPSGDDFAGMIAAVSALPADALVVAAPELSERLPALTGRHVVAALDRSTIVFSGTREQGEARLRARAALLAGDADGGELARKAGITATHAIYDPRATNTPRCSGDVHRGEAWAVCELALDVVNDAAALERSDKPGTDVLATAECEAAPLVNEKRDPWAAGPPAVLCRATLPAGATGPAVLRMEVETGRAADELRVEVREQKGAVRRGSTRLDCCGLAGLELPSIGAGTVEIRIASSFLPAVKPRKVTIVSR
jgi:hypothetical protein